MSAESTSFIIDVSDSMIQDGNIAKVVAYLEYALLDKCKRLRKTDWISCYLANCHYTRNSQGISGIYDVQQFIAPVTTKETLQLLQEIQHYSKDYITDKLEERIPEEKLKSMIQCLLVASLDIRSKFNKRKLLRQLVVFTDDLNGLDLTEDEVTILQDELNSRLILVNCSKNSTNKDVYQSKWGQLIEAIPDSRVYSINELLMDITTAKIATVKPVRVFSGELRLGVDPIRLLKDDFISHEDPHCLCIQVEGFPATKAISSLNRRTVLKREEGDSVEYKPVKSIVEYEIVEDDRKISVSQESISKAYRYGSDYVVLPSVLEDQRFIKTPAGLDIRGFLDRKQMQYFFLMSESKFIFADSKTGTAADISSFNALVDVMLEYDKVAIARFVAKVNGDIQMCLLCPLIVDTRGDSGDKMKSEHSQRALVLSRLPFAEDERVSDFPRLLDRTTTSGKRIENDTNTETVDELMSEYIDSLDLDIQGFDSTPDTKYYSMLNPTAKDTSLSLPTDCQMESGNDPTRIPAIHLHRQQQVLLEFIHQKLINKSTEFQVPGLPDQLREKITPHFNPKSSQSQSKLVELLAIKKVNKENKNSDELYESDNDEAIPSFEAIMALGAR